MNLKVLHIIDSGGFYGAEVMLLHLVEEQTKLGLEPTIASIGAKSIAEKPFETEALKRGFKVKKFRMTPGPNLKGAVDILRYANEANINILHSHGYKGNILFGFIPKRIRNLPVISTLHGWTSAEGLLKMRLYQWLDILSLKYIDAIVVVNKDMLQNPKLKNLRRVNFYTVNNGIPVVGNKQNILNQKIQKKLDQSIIDFCCRGFTIGSIGRLSKEKRYNCLIEAIGLLAQKGIDARLIIIGEGNQRNDLENLITRLKLKGRVMLPGYRQCAKNYIHNFNIFVLPSLSEGLPITILEAMQAKIPIVATKVGGIPEVLGNGSAGMLIKASDSLNLAYAIKRIHKDKKLVSDMTQVAYRRAINIYDSKTMAKGYLKVYKDIIFRV
jgi:glycosyltransferase involved in cell wall biosynthesis